MVQHGASAGAAPTLLPASCCKRASAYRSAVQGGRTTIQFGGRALPRGGGVGQRQKPKTVSGADSESGEQIGGRRRAAAPPCLAATEEGRQLLVAGFEQAAVCGRQVRERSGAEASQRVSRQKPGQTVRPARGRCLAAPAQTTEQGGKPARTGRERNGTQNDSTAHGPGQERLGWRRCVAGKKT